MKFNEEQNKQLDYLSELAVQYVRIAGAIEEVVESIKKVEGDLLMDDKMTYVYATRGIDYIAENIKVRSLPEEVLWDRLNQCKDAFKTFKLKEES